MSKVIEVIKAEAWVNTMPIKLSPGGTLIAEVAINGNGIKASLDKKEVQDNDTDVLVLEIVLSVTDEYTANPQKLKYSEKLQRSDEYKLIEIHFRLEKLAEITEIPVMK